MTLDLTPLTPGTLTLNPVTPAAGSLTGPSAGDLAVFNAGGTGWDFRRYVTLVGEEATTVPLTIQGHASQSGNLLAIQNSAGTSLARFGTQGHLVIEDFTLTGAHRAQITATLINPSAGGLSVVAASGRAKGPVNSSTRLNGFFAEVSDHADVVNKTITGAVDNGSGLIRITATAHGFATGDKIAVYGVGGTTEANGAWTITVITADTFDLQGSTFTNAYTSGGTATNRPSLYGVFSVVKPILARGGLTGTALHADDVAGFVAYNGGSALAADAYYVGRNAGIAGDEWTTGLGIDGNVQKGIWFGGTISVYGIDFSEATWGTAPQILFANNAKVSGRNAADSADVELFKITTSDRLQLVAEVDRVNFRTASAGIQITVGDSTTDAANKVGRIGAAHYTNAEEPVGVIVCSNTSTTNQLIIGGGSGVFNAATDISFRTGATVTTLSGTERLAINSTGVITVANGGNIAVGTTTGTKIGTATTQKLGFWNATPVVQPTTIADADGTLADITTKFNSLLSKLETIGLIAA